MKRNPSIADLVARFPVDDDRFNPIPVGESSTVDQRSSDDGDYAPLFRGPFVATVVDSQLERTLFLATCVKYDETAGKAFVEGLAVNNERPVRIYPGTVSTPGGDGAFVVENTHEWSFRPGTMFQFRPLMLDDHKWMGVPRQDDIASLARFYSSVGDL